MIGVDTNVLVRFLVHDDPEQGARADRFFAERSVGDPAFVSLVVVVETTWVLARRYGFDIATIARAVSALLTTDEVVVEAPDIVRRAMRDARVDRTDFADAVIAHLGVEAGCDGTVTFDRRAAAAPGMLSIA
jgi:predicted nucleic-acid-binding protein